MSKTKEDKEITKQVSRFLSDQFFAGADWAKLSEPSNVMKTYSWFLKKKQNEKDDKNP